MSLTDDQVSAELRKMKAFIEKEAQEKAKEIRLKADEEYEIEKSSIVRSECAAIDTTYEQKLKKASLAQQITKSTIGNKTRLRILGTKEEVLEEIFSSAEEELKKIASDESKYLPILTGLIEEAVLIMLEKKVLIRVKESDVEVAKKAIEAASKAFEEKAKFPVEINIDENEYLKKDIAGGVLVINGTGKIEVDNTLEARLRLLSEEALPGIRLELFGISKSRKFFD